MIFLHFIDSLFILVSWAGMGFFVLLMPILFMGFFCWPLILVINISERIQRTRRVEAYCRERGIQPPPRRWSKAEFAKRWPLPRLARVAAFLAYVVIGAAFFIGGVMAGHQGVPVSQGSVSAGITHR